MALSQPEIRQDPALTYTIEKSMRPDLSFVILTWNSGQYIKDCLHSLVAKCTEDRLRFEICVVDNGSSDDTLSIIEDFCAAYKPPLKTLRLSRNMGTTYSRNIGLRSTKGKYLCILDSDTRILNGSLSTVLSRLDDKEIGIIAPRLILPGGEIQNSVKKFPAFWHKIVKVPRAILKLQTKNYDFYESFPFESETFVDTAISACWFFKSDLLEDIGLLDERIFYSPEDLDFCVRVWKNGKKILYSPTLTVLHSTQQISHRSPFSGLTISHLWGLLYYYRKHGGWFSARNLHRLAEHGSDAYSNTHWVQHES